MGQYLAIGLATQIRISKPAAAAAQFGLDQLQQEMQQTLHYDPAIYTANEGDGRFYTFTLKDDVLQAQLIPFLTHFYPLIYSDPNDYDEVMQKLASLASNEWLGWAEQKSAAAFQWDTYGEADYLRPGNTSVAVNYQSLLLSMEGKIMMETYGRQFNFFKYAMQQTFSAFTLAGALRVYITG